MNIFTNYPPVIAWIVISIALVSMAQFGSTEKLAAAFAWLIFIAILLANGPAAMKNLSTLTATSPISSSGADKQNNQ
jgi:hypothetical protein